MQMKFKEIPVIYISYAPIIRDLGGVYRWFVCLSAKPWS